ncbi:MAG: permease [Candidatus Saganbacteria bacterium]|nr:permease [Candidatus Saganbacteria bacterium]
MFNWIANLIVYNLFKLDPTAKLSQSLHFFVYDVLKIAFSILVIITLISFLRTYVSAQKIKELLSKQRFGAGYFIASFFGAISPFCSCSSIPLFIGFIRAGIPIGVAFAFLITSPLVNEILFVLMIGTFGLKIALLYAAFGILLGVFGGMLLQRFNLESDIIRIEEEASVVEMPKDLKGKFQYTYGETAWIFKKVFPFIVIGVAIGAYIHGYVPTEWIRGYINSDSIFSVPIAVMIGVPLYAGCSTLVPVIFAFTQKGIAIGTAMAFMMAVAGLSFPEAVILKSVMKTRLLVIFFTIVAIGIILVGYIFNLILSI